MLLAERPVELAAKGLVRGHMAVGPAMTYRHVDQFAGTTDLCRTPVPRHCQLHKDHIRRPGVLKGSQTNYVWGKRRIVSPEHKSSSTEPDVQ